MPCQRGTLRLATAGIAVAAALACASASQAGGSRTSRSILLADEIGSASVATAYEAVTRLRPEWLRRRGRVSIRDPGAGDVVVYLDGNRFGGARALSGIRAEIVLQMEYLAGTDATTRFGTGHGGGVILVRTR